MQGILFEGEVKFRQFDSTDKIAMSDNITYIRANPYNLIEDFKKVSPKKMLRIL